MLVYNIKEKVFIDSSKGEIDYNDIIILAYCSMSNSFVLTLIEEDYDLCLHNEDENNDKIASKLFKLKDEKFKQYLDYYKNKN